MDDAKKKIIINEILHWKKNRLLPETYCDFLLALYTEGNHDTEPRQLSKDERKNGHIHKYLLIGFILLLLPLTLLVIYFTELSFVLQMTIVGFLLLIIIVVTAYFIRKRSFYQVPLSITFIQLLICSLYVVEHLSNGGQLWIGLTVLFNCLLWIIFGRIYRLIYLIISGSIGLVLFIGFIIF